jgi:hypothetical protein
MKLVARIAAAVIAVLVAACGSSAGPPDARVIDGPPPGGTFTLTWTLHDGATALTCADLGGATIAVSITGVGDGFGVTDVFDCASATGTTRAVAPGKYNLDVQLTGPTGALAAVIPFRDVVAVTSSDTKLDPIDFAVMARGGLKFRLVAQGVAANCTGTAPIAGMQLRIRDAQNLCEPATFMVAAGAGTAASTYTDDCQTAVVGPCIERDQIVTVSDLRSGSVKLDVSGQVAGQPCWGGTNYLTVPTMSTVRDYGALSFLHDNTACPP